MRPFRLTLPLACLFFAIASTAQVPGELAITNPGFETGDLSGWILWPGDDPMVSIVTDEVSSGANAAKVSGGTGALYKVVTGEVSLEPGAFYCFVAKVMIPLADVLQEGQSLYLASKVTTPSGEVWFESSKVVTSADDAGVWYQLYYGLTYPEDATELTVEFKWTGTGAGDPGCVYVDDVRIVRMETPANVTNLGFEDPEASLYGGGDGWWTWSYLPVEPVEGEETWIDTAISRSGDRSLAMVPQEWSMWLDELWWGGYFCWTGYTLYESVDYYQGGDNFYMSAWAMSPDDDPIEGAVNVRLELAFKDINGEHLTNSVNRGGRVWSEKQLDETMSYGEWHFLECYIQCPQVEGETPVDRFDFNLVLTQTEYGYGIIYVDDVFIARGTSSSNDVESANSRLPVEISLSQNYPNPFNPTTTIEYALPIKGFVEIKIIDVRGREVSTLAAVEKTAGTHQVTWNGLDNTGSPVASGVYFYIMTAEGFSETRKLLLLH